MRILLTGSSGGLGRTLAPRLAGLGHEVIGLDPVAAPSTTVVGSIADRGLVRRVLVENRIEAIVHGGALHKPDIDRNDRMAFIDVNVVGTGNLLEEAVVNGVGRFVMTSTTSLMISDAIRAGVAGGAFRAEWITEELCPMPRNIYGVTKLSAEHLARLHHQLHRLPVIILRTARFFPEEDDMAHAIEQSGDNTKANELLFRRLSVEDAAQAHVAALERAPALGFGTFIISAPTPFSRDDCAELIVDAPSVVDRYFPDYRRLYAPRGWSMFRSIDRVYDAGLAERVLGFRCRTDFQTVLDRLAREDAGRS
jgi:UDP-glucose 4-epimerase